MPRQEPLAVLLLFILLAIVFTWPLALHLGSAVEDTQDALLNVWIMAWDGHALFSDPGHLFDANIFYPYTRTLAYSELLLSNALLSWPITWLSGNPVLGYNLVLLLTFVLSGFGVYLLVRRWTGSGWGGVAAGIVFAFNAYKLANLAQIQLLSLHWLPFALLFLDKFLAQVPSSKFLVQVDKETRRQGDKENVSPSPRLPISLSLPRRDAVLFVLFFVLQCLASFYYAVLAALAVGLYVLCFFAVRPRALTWASLARLAMVGLVAIALVVPFTLPYLQVQRELGFHRTLAESEPFSASLRQWTEALPNNLVYGPWLAPKQPVVIGGYPLDALFPGVVALLLAVWGLAARHGGKTVSPFPPREGGRGVRSASPSHAGGGGEPPPQPSPVNRGGSGWGFPLLLALGAFLLSLGPTLFLSPGACTGLPLPYRLLYDYLPGFQALRAPVRFAALAFLGLAGLVGFAGAKSPVRSPQSPAAGRKPWSLRPASCLLPPASCLLHPALLTALLVLEALTVPAARIVPLPTGAAVPPVYRWLAQQPRTVVLELPMLFTDAPAQGLLTQYLSVYHWQPTPDGYSGFIPPKHGEVVYEMQRFPSARALALLRGLDVGYVVVHTAQVKDWPGMQARLAAFSDDLALAQSFSADLVYRMLPRPAQRQVALRAFFPEAAARGQPYNAYLIVQVQGEPLAIKPTHQVAVEALWAGSSGATQKQQLAVSLPIVTSEAAVVPVPLPAPAAIGQYTLTLRLDDPLLGRLEASGPVHVADQTEPPPQPIPARLVAWRTDKATYQAGETVQVSLRWRALGKIDAYYSLFVRLVDSAGQAVVQRDGQPQGGQAPTLLWVPGQEIDDTWALPLPATTPPGRYTLEVGFYNASDLAPRPTLDATGQPVWPLTLGTIEVTPAN
ncbi:MAG: hypothetical protein FJZ89_07245 [Chloroflexi bacterium]|nr:hypothetical protein [Chloroflexota bacterium]